MSVAIRANAQVVEPSIDVQTLWPVAGATPTAVQRSAEVSPHLSLSFALAMNHAVQPLVLRSVSDPQRQVSAIDQVNTVDFLWSFALFDRVQIMAALPLVVGQTGEGIAPIVGGGASSALSLIAVRDVRFDVGVQLLRRPRRTFANGFALRADMGVTVPTGDLRFQGAGSPVLVPMLVGDLRAGWLTVTANAGARVRFESRTFASVVFGSQILASVGVAVRHPSLQRLAVSVDGQVLVPVGAVPQIECAVGPCSQSSQLAAELFVGGRYAVDRGRDVEVTLGVGAPLSGAAGVPLVRGLIGLSYTPRGLDDDGDGVRESDDRCPTEAEDRDGFQDEDGCPDLDNDADGIADTADRCPNEPEDVDNFQDGDGCPEADNDGDGVLDADDVCAVEAAGSRPDPSQRGCPLRDRDGDEVLDADDQCPDEAVGERADPAHRGCPLPDRDHDGVADAVDQCVSDPEGETPDRFRRGCPDPDRDHDGVLNEVDACVAQPETINGVQDQDGCPDAGEELVSLGRSAVLFSNVIRLPVRARTLRAQDRAMFAQAAQRLRGLGSELARVTVQVVGPARDPGDAAALRLAGLVLDALVEAGLSRSTLTTTAWAAPPPVAGTRQPARPPVGEVRVQIMRNAGVGR